MVKKNLKKSLHAILRSARMPLLLSELSVKMDQAVPERTLRRWLSDWVDEGHVTRTGKGRASRYQFNKDQNSRKPTLGFLNKLDDDLKTTLLNQLRDLWTHTSTALEGNSLSLGDTHFILEEGLTISGKSIKDHQEIVGHAQAIDLLYQSLEQPLSQALIFNLHQAVLTERINDIYKPVGSWKVEINGTYAISEQGKQVFIEYAHPIYVPELMEALIDTINTINVKAVDVSNAAVTYAKIHMAVAHIHPFWDGNGRIARLLANIPLLKAGLPPLLIQHSQRRQYLQQLAWYQLRVGQLNKTTGLWPQIDELDGFTDFCEGEYSTTKDLVNTVLAIQQKRMGRSS